MKIKLKASEITLSSTPNTVNNATLVRIVADGANAVITHTAQPANTDVGTCTVLTGGTVYIVKEAADELSVDNDVKAVSVAYQS